MNSNLQTELDRELVYYSKPAAIGFILTSLLVIGQKFGTLKYNDLLNFLSVCLVVTPTIRFMAAFLHLKNKLDLAPATKIVKISTIINAIFWSSCMLVPIVEFELSNPLADIYVLAISMGLTIASLTTLIYSFYLALSFQFIFLIPSMIYLGYLYYFKDNPYAGPLIAVYTITLIFLFRQNKVLYQQAKKRILYQLDLEKINLDLKESQALLLEEKAKVLNSTKLATMHEISGELTHEINNPLSIVSGNIELIQKAIRANKADSDYIEKKLSNSIVGINRINNILKSLRYFSRQSSDNQKLNVHNVNDIIEEAVQHYREKITANHIDIKFHSLDENYYILCKPIEISQVLLNILNNAIKALNDIPSEKRKIHISVKSKNSRVKIAIANSGNLITDAVKSNLFKPSLVNIEDAPKSNIYGIITGVGLSVSRNIIEEHKGSLYFDETADLTTFVIELPINHNFVS